MPIFLLAMLLKGPSWFRVLILLGFLGIFIFGFVIAANNIRYATERTVPAHVHHIRAHHHALPQ